MAWSSAALESYEETRLALDKPLIAPQMVFPTVNYAKWVESGQVGAGNIATWTDRAATGYPAYRSYDGFPGYITKSDATAASTWYLCYDFAIARTFDCAFIIGSNFGTLALTTIEIQIADDNAFTTNLTTIASFSASDDRRADLALEHGGDSQRYTTRYLWLKLSKGSNFTPEIGELILGRRRQLEYKPDRPFDEYRMHEDFSSGRTEGGVYHKAVYSRRGFELDASFVIDDSDYEDDFVGFFRDCRGMFVYVADPYTSPNAWHFMMREGMGTLPRIAANRREGRIFAVEQGPEAYFLDVEVNG